MTLKEACAVMRERGCTNLWFLFILQPARVETMTDEFVEAHDRRQQKHNPGSWEIRGERYIYFVPDKNPETAVRVFYAA